MNNWPIVKLGTLADFKNGLNFGAESWAKGMKIVGVSDFWNRVFPDYESLAEINPKGVVREQDLLEEDDILFVRSNGNRQLIGRCLWIRDLPESVSHSGFTIRLRFKPNPELHIPFYFYLFRSALIQQVLSEHGGGTNINNLNQGILERLLVSQPPLAEQMKIANVLSAYDNLIANNQRQISLLESMAEEIYREWFVRMRFPGHQNSPKSHLKWRVVPLEFLGTFLNGYPFDPSEWFEEGLPIVKIKELNSGVSQATPRNPGEKIPDRYQVDNGDVIFSWSGSLVAQIWHQGPALVNQHLFKVTPTPGIPTGFLFLSIKFSIPIFETLTTGATMQHIKRKELRFVKIRIPPQPVMDQFVTLVEPLLEGAMRLKQAALKLKATRDALLPRLISGKLRVDHLDIQAPPSMRAQTAQAA